MKTIILGYADAGGHGEPQVICAPNVPAAEQIRIFQAAKRNHEYPKGINRLEQRVLPDDYEIAINLGDSVRREPPVSSPEPKKKAGK